MVSFHFLVAKCLSFLSIRSWRRSLKFCITQRSISNGIVIFIFNSSIFRGLSTRTLLFGYPIKSSGMLKDVAIVGATQCFCVWKSRDLETIFARNLLMLLWSSAMLLEPTIVLWKHVQLLPKELVNRISIVSSTECYNILIMILKKIETYDSRCSPNCYLQAM